MTIEIGGKKIGRRVARLTHHVRGHDPLIESVEARAAASGLALFVDSVCRLAAAVTVGRFDRRYNTCAWNYQRTAEHALTWENWIIKR